MFSYLYYRVYVFYYRRHDHSSDLFATWIVSVMEFLNILCALLLLSQLSKIWFAFEAPFAAILFLSMLIVNHYRFNRAGFIQRLYDRWQDEPVFQRYLRGYGVIVYMISSVLIPMLLLTFFLR